MLEFTRQIINTVKFKIYENLFFKSKRWYFEFSEQCSCIYKIYTSTYIELNIFFLLLYYCYSAYYCLYLLFYICFNYYGLYALFNFVNQPSNNTCIGYYKIIIFHVFSYVYLLTKKSMNFFFGLFHSVFLLIIILI